MKFLRVLFIIIAAVVVLIAILMMIAPTKTTVSRSTVIQAPKDVVWNNVSRFENMNQWSPWADYDTAMVVTLEGTDGTVGAVSRWEGNNKVGKGSQTITALEAPNRAEIRVDFVEPFAGKADSYIQLDDTAGAVKVTWGFNSESPRPWNIFNLFMDVDAMVGKDYDRGLESLKAMSESQAAAAEAKTYRGYKVSESELPARTFIGKRTTLDMKDVSTYYMNSMKKTMDAVQAAGLQMAGSPCGLYWSWDVAAGKADMTAALPVQGADQAPAGYEVYRAHAGNGISVDHYGDYEKIGEAHFAIDDYMKEKSITSLPSLVVEEYVTGPMMEKDTAKWLTKIYYYL